MTVRGPTDLSQQSGGSRESVEYCGLRR